MKKILLLIFFGFCLTGCGKERTITCINDYSYKDFKNIVTVTIKSEDNIVMSHSIVDEFESDNLDSVDEKETYYKDLCQDFGSCKVVRNGNHVTQTRVFKCFKKTDIFKCDYDETLKFYKDSEYTKCTIKE